MDESTLYPLKYLGGYNADQLFDILNLSLPAWVLLAVAPRWKYTRTLTLIPPIIHASLYLLTVLSLAQSEGGDFSSLSGVYQLFRDPSGVFAGWTHYIVFDLLVGRTIVEDAIQRPISLVFWILLVVPCLFFTLMLGPAGWLCYTVLSATILPAKAGKDKTT